MYNQARNKATQKYQRAHLEQIAIRVRKGERAFYKAIAEKHGLSLVELFRRAVLEYDSNHTAPD